MAVRFAARSVDAGIGAQHLLYGVLCDARDPPGTQLSRRSRRQLALLGFGPRTAQAGPASALGTGHRPNRFTADLGAPP